MKSYKQYLTEKNKDFIMVNGEKRSRLNSLGKPIHSTEEGIINFWKWFGDSKVVDDSGRPLVVYHGTDWDLVGDMKLGMHKAIFLTDKKTVAQGFGENVVKVYCKMVDPYFEHFNGGNVYGSFPVGKIDKGNSDSLVLGDVIKKAREKNKDGVYAEDLLPMTDRDGLDNLKSLLSTWLIVFSPNQIKSVDNGGDFSSSSNKITESISKEDKEKFRKIVKGKSPSEIIHYPWDKIAFGFSIGDTITIPLNKLKVKYKDDMLNTEGSMKSYFKGTPFNDLPLIQVSYDKGKFYIEDGHHRYVYAKQLKLKNIQVEVENIKDNPILALGLDSVDDLINLSKVD